MIPASEKLRYPNVSTHVVPDELAVRAWQSVVGLDSGLRCEAFPLKNRALRKGVGAVQFLSVIMYINSISGRSRAHQIDEAYLLDGLSSIVRFLESDLDISCPHSNVAYRLWGWDVC
jgi:hypothetical protein